jgi:hypothetical protein
MKCKHCKVGTVTIVDVPNKGKMLQCNNCIYSDAIAEYVNETVDHPAHYNKGNVECIEAIKSAIVGLNPTEAFYTGNVIKYMWRWKEKGQKNDLEKAKFYIDLLIKDLV